MLVVEIRTLPHRPAGAVQGQSGTAEATDFNGEPVLSAYGPMLRSGFGMAVKIAREEYLDARAGR